MFPEDDEISPEEAQDELRDIHDQMRNMSERENYLRRRAREKSLDAVTAKIAELAQNAGHALGANEALGNRIKFLERRIEVRDERLEELKDRDEWKARAEAAEGKLKRRRKR